MLSRPSAGFHNNTTTAIRTRQLAGAHTLTEGGVVIGAPPFFQFSFVVEPSRWFLVCFPVTMMLWAGGLSCVARLCIASKGLFHCVRTRAKTLVSSTAREPIGRLLWDLMVWACGKTRPYRCVFVTTKIQPKADDFFLLCT